MIKTLDGRMVESFLPDAKKLASNVVTRRPRGSHNDRKIDVTVVTVTFNCIKGRSSEILKQCFESVQSQKGDVVIEHLIVDGASKDGTKEIIATFPNKRHLVRYLSEPDKGIYDAMNKAIALARGKYLIFLNSDDFFHNPRGMADSFKRLEETKSDFSYAPVRVVDEKGNEKSQHLHAHPDINLFFASMPFSHQSLLVRTKVLRELGGFNNREFKSSADFDQIMRMVVLGTQGCYVPTVFSTFRTGGFSSMNLDVSQAECAKIFSDFYANYLGIPFSKEDAENVYKGGKLIPREYKVRLVKLFKDTFAEYPSPRIEIIQPSQVRCEKGSVRYYPTYSDKWLASRNLLWNDEELMRFMETELPKDEVTASDSWSIFSSFMCSAEGAWSDGKFGICFRAPDKLLKKNLQLHLCFSTIGRPDMNAHRIGIAVNGRVFADFKADKGVNYDYCIELPKSVDRNGVFAIEVNCSSPICWQEFKETIDIRSLAMLFKRVYLREC